MTFILPVGVTQERQEPALSNSAASSSRVRSWPPTATSMSISLGGPVTRSTTRSLLWGVIARRHVLRNAAAPASLQSCRLAFKA